MKILSLNIALPRTVEYRGRSVATGIFKEPTGARLALTYTGLAGDGQADRSAHGGPDKAAYVYSYANYAYWAQELERPELPFGQFGENLTVEDLPDDAVFIGDTFQIADAVVQVTQPRIPCFKLGLRMGLPNFPKRFLESGRTGFYLRVLREGEIGAGDGLRRLKADPLKLSVRESLAALFPGGRQKAVIQKALQIGALSRAWREDLEKRLMHFKS